MLVATYKCSCKYVFSTVQDDKVLNLVIDSRSNKLKFDTCELCVRVRVCVCLCRTKTKTKTKATLPNIFGGQL